MPFAADGETDVAELIRMPEVLAGAAEAAVATWLVQPGDTVEVNRSLAEIETDKAIVELAAESAGIIGRLLASEGETIAVGDPLLVLLAAGEGDDAIEAALATGDLSAPAAAAPAAAALPPAAIPLEPQTARKLAAASASTSTPAPARAEPAPAPPEAPPTSSGRILATPLVRRLASQSGVDIAGVLGTGPNGRIVRRDLERHLAHQTMLVDDPSTRSVAPAPVTAADGGPHEDVPLDRMRRTIARRLTESKSTVPHFYLVADCRVDDLLALRAQINQGAPRKISVNDFVLKAVAAAFVEVPAANAIWNGDSIRRFSTVDISVAVATDGGLMTPVLRSVEQMSLGTVSATVAELAERARANRLRQHELEGGSFSVSNLGMYGTSEFSAILNPPQSGILAVGAAQKRPVITPDGGLDVGTVLIVTLSADHRVLDGAVAAEWLAAFKRAIENPLTTLI